MENIKSPISEIRAGTGTLLLDQHSTNKTTHRQDCFIGEMDTGPVHHDTIVNRCQATQLQQIVITQNADSIMTWPEELLCLLIDYAVKNQKPTLILTCHYLYQLSFKMKCNTVICQDKTLVTNIVERQNKTRPIYTNFFGLIKEKPFEEMTWAEKYETYPELRLDPFRADGYQGLTNLRSLGITLPFMIFRISNGDLTIPDAVKIRDKKIQWITDTLNDPNITSEVKRALSNKIVQNLVVDEVVTDTAQLQIIGSDDFIESYVNDNWIQKNVFSNPVRAERFLKDTHFREVFEHGPLRIGIDKNQITIEKVWNSARDQTGKFMLSKYCETYYKSWSGNLLSVRWLVCLTEEKFDNLIAAKGSTWWFDFKAEVNWNYPHSQEYWYQQLMLRYCDFGGQKMSNLENIITRSHIHKYAFFILDDIATLRSFLNLPDYVQNRCGDEMIRFWFDNNMMSYEELTTTYPYYDEIGVDPIQSKAIQSAIRNRQLTVNDALTKPLKELMSIIENTKPTDDCVVQ